MQARHLRQQRRRRTGGVRFGQVRYADGEVADALVADIGGGDPGRQGELFELADAFGGAPACGS